MKPILNFSYRLFNIEVRSCGEHLLPTVPHITAEIIEWSTTGHNCWTIAHWKKHKEGYDLIFCGNRPFVRTVDMKDFWMLAGEGQALLDKYFEEMNE